jgi:oligopeptide/dipeptide ABC transporter ATP-binding protein
LEIEDPILKVENLAKYYPVRRGLRSLFSKSKLHVKAVDDVSFAVKLGETFGLVGESGSGKTTLGSTLMMLQPPSSGSIIFQGKKISEFKGRELRQIRKNMQIVFQNPYASLDPRQRIGDIVAEPLRVFRYDKKEIVLKVNQTIESVGLPLGSLKHFPHQLSGGQRQRVAIARALVLDPEFIILDEPTSALDASVQAQILNLLRKIQEERKISFLFITHNVNVVKYMADRVAVMYAGKLVEVGLAIDVLKRPLHPYTIALISSIPQLNPKKRTEKALGGEVPSAINPPAGCRFNPRCPFSQDLCRTTEPPLRQVENSLVACHFAESISEHR